MMKNFKTFYCEGISNFGGDLYQKIYNDAIKHLEGVEFPLKKELRWTFELPGVKPEENVSKHNLKLSSDQHKNTSVMVRINFSISNTKHVYANDIITNYRRGRPASGYEVRWYPYEDNEEISKKNEENHLQNFIIRIAGNYDKEWVLDAISHEIVHVCQELTGFLGYSDKQSNQYTKIIKGLNKKSDQQALHKTIDVEHEAVLVSFFQCIKNKEYSEISYQMLYRSEYLYNFDFKDFVTKGTDFGLTRNDFDEFFEYVKISAGNMFAPIKKKLITGDLSVIKDIGDFSIFYILPKTFRLMKKEFEYLGGELGNIKELCEKSGKMKEYKEIKRNVERAVEG